MALVDGEDYERVMAAGPWHVLPGVQTTYAGRNAKRPTGGYTTQGLHIFLTGIKDGVDHINGDGLDNRRSNLRPATTAQNAANRAARKDSRSGYKGVFPNPSGRPWRAQIGANGKKKHLGLFHTPEAAAEAYNAAALELWGEFARLNIIPTTSKEN